MPQKDTPKPKKNRKKVEKNLKKNRKKVEKKPKKGRKKPEKNPKISISIIPFKYFVFQLITIHFNTNINGFLQKLVLPTFTKMRSTKSIRTLKMKMKMKMKMKVKLNMKMILKVKLFIVSVKIYSR